MATAQPLNSEMIPPGVSETSQSLTETLALTTPTPLDLLRIAVMQNADIDKLARLMELQERWERNEARKAYVAAMNAFKSNPPAILKNRHVDQGKEAVLRSCHARQRLPRSDPGARQARHLIPLDNEAAGRKPWIEVTCVLTHQLGHSEETTLGGPPDQTGGKNTIQAIASTVTYLERYTLLGATGLAGRQHRHRWQAAGIFEKRRRRHQHRSHQ